MSCEWVWWSWQDVGNLGELIGGIGTVSTLGLLVWEYKKRTGDLEREQAKLVLVRLWGRRLRADNRSQLFVDRVAWHLPFKQKGERLVWVYATDRGDFHGAPIGIATNRNAIEAGAHVEYELNGDESSDGCYLIFRDTASRWWRRDVGGTLSEYKPTEHEQAGPAPASLPPGPATPGAGDD